MSPINRDFRYLNVDGAWQGFSLEGVEVGVGGSLVLAALPATDGLNAAATSSSPVAPVVGAALAVDEHGNVFYSRPDLHRIWWIEACSRSEGVLPCVVGPGSDPGELRSPRGLLALHSRHALLICDAGNRRVQLIDPYSGQVREIWSRPLRAPVVAAADRAGTVYVVDVEARTVHRRREGCDWESGFSEALYGSALLVEPVGIAVVDAPAGPGPRIYVLDRARRAVFVFDEQGQALLGESGQPIEIGRDVLVEPFCVAANGHSIYVCDRADEGSSQVFRFGASDGFALVGVVPGLEGASAILSNDDQLWVLHGDSGPASWHEQRAYRRTGAFVSPSIDVGRTVSWTSLHVSGAPLSPGAHVELAYRFFDDPAAEDSSWQRVPLDVMHVHLRGTQARYMRVRVELGGDGATSPVVDNLSVRYDQPGYLAHLPAIFNPGGDGFLTRFLGLFESFNLQLEQRTEALPVLFDPEAASQEALPWLASTLGIELDERWPEDKRRAAIARAYHEHGWRGTPAALVRAIEFETGVAAVVIEPIMQASWWALPVAADPCGPTLALDDGSSGTGSLLGCTTTLAAAPPESAVVGSAVFDRSRMLADGDFGVPLFDSLTHRVVVHVYRGAADDPATRAAVTRVIERDKPAHVAYRLTSIEPSFTVGVQACVGFDTVVAGPPEATALGSSRGGIQLTGDPPARIGKHSRVGQGLRL